jgi:hypothetical protein
MTEGQRIQLQKWVDLWQGIALTACGCILLLAVAWWLLGLPR